MNNRKSYDCHKISEGIAQGEVLCTTDDICFYLVDPETGNIIEDDHEAHGKSVAGKVLIFPSGKGSSVVQADGLYQLNMHGNAPKAMVIEYADTVLVSSAIIMGIPMVNKVEDAFYKNVKQNDNVTVNADNQLITVHT
jgi:predicted aconitase with swiveling domain